MPWIADVSRSRVDGSRHQDVILSLRDDVKRLSLDQNTLSGSFKRHNEKTVSQSEQRDNQIIAMIRELQNMITRQEVQAADRSEALKVAVDSLSAVQADVSAVLSRQNDILSSSQRLERVFESHIQEIRPFRESRPTSRFQSTAASTSSTNLAADNADILARILRAELKQQLEPVLQEVDGAREQIEQLVLAISARANYQAIFQTTAESTTGFESHDGAQRKKPDLINEVDGTGPSTLAVNNRAGSPIHKEIPLFTYSYYMATKLGKLTINLRTYRLRNVIISSQTRFFRLRVTFIPRPWLCSRGFSALYSSGPNSHGYYDICPSIMPFRIISEDSPIMDLIRADDVIGFRSLVAQGQLSLREQSECGNDLLTVRPDWFAHADNSSLN